MSTVYIGTHWLSDVLLGWAAGLLILLALPWFEPLIARCESWILALRDRWFARLRGSGTARRPLGAPVVLVPPAADRADAPACETVSAARSRTPAYLAPGPHTTRAERTPVTPAGSRRPHHPPHTERHPRGPASTARQGTTG